MGSKGWCEDPKPMASETPQPQQEEEEKLNTYIYKLELYKHIYIRIE